MFLQSKDDNLLLQIGGLIYAIILCNPAPEMKAIMTTLYGLEAIKDEKSYCKIKCQADLVESCIGVMTMVPPYRNFTTRLFCRIVQCLQPDFELNKDQRTRLLEAFYGVTELMLSHQRQNGMEVGLRYK